MGSKPNLKRPFQLAALTISLALPALLLPVWQSFGQGSATKIAYVRDGDIWVMSDAGAVGGGVHTRLTSGGGDTSPTWSPGQTQIAFLRRSGKGKNQSTDLWVMDADGSNLDQLTGDGGPKGGSEWSPDGDKIVYFARADAGNSDICVWDVATGTTEQLTDHPADDAWPTWSPNGSMIAFTTSRTDDDGPGIYVMDAVGEANGGASKRILDAGIDAVWSPELAVPLGNGATSRIAYLAPGNDIWVSELDPGTGGVIGLQVAATYRLTTNPKLDTFPTWSPDGTEIAFQTDRPKTDVYRMRGDEIEGPTNTPVPLATNRRTEGRPAWLR